jgi:hypothetical protein
MTTPRKPLADQAAGETIFTEVFKMVQQLNAAAGPVMVKKGTRSGNMTFRPKIIVEEANERRYTCGVEIYTQASDDAGTEIGLEWSSTDPNQFKQALATVVPALSALARQGFVSDTFTVGLIAPDGEESEVYAPATLEPGMYSLSEEEDED